MPTTQITQRQIADGAINDAKVAAGANIATTKLADGANFVKKDGTVAFTGNADLGNNRITNLGAPTAAADAANKSYVDTQVGNLSSLYKYKNVRAATTANITISNPGTASFDGVTLANGDRLLVKNQTAQAENGIYVFNGSASALTRATDADAWTELVGCLIAIDEGTTLADTRFYCPVNSGGTLGTTAVTFSQDVSNGLVAANFVDKEIPTGSINGSNTAFTLANTPVSGSEHVYLNGVLQESGAGNDYTISGNSITFTTAPLTGEKLRVSYRK